MDDGALYEADRAIGVMTMLVETSWVQCSVSANCVCNDPVLNIGHAPDLKQY